jgi:hypothetical protein
LVKKFYGILGWRDKKLKNEASRKEEEENIVLVS